MAGHSGMGAMASEKGMMAPPGAPYRKVSELVKLPEYLPGLGTLYVDPTTLPYLLTGGSAVRG